MRWLTELRCTMPNRPLPREWRGTEYVPREPPSRDDYDNKTIIVNACSRLLLDRAALILKGETSAAHAAGRTLLDRPRRCDRVNTWPPTSFLSRNEAGLRRRPGPIPNGSAAHALKRRLRWQTSSCRRGRGPGFGCVQGASTRRTKRSSIDRDGIAGGVCECLGSRRRDATAARSPTGGRASQFNRWRSSR